MTDTETDKDSGLQIIWMTKAIVEYNHGPDWFRRRIKDGKIRTAPQPGTSKTYLILDDVIKEHEKGGD